MDTASNSNSFTRDLFGLIGIPWPSAHWLQNAIPYGLLTLPLAGSIWLSRGSESRGAKATHRSADSPSDESQTPTRELESGN
jgi:hypothetical protein